MKDLIRADFTEISGLLSMKHYLHSYQDYPTAFISANDEMAMGAIKAAKEHGMSIPDDMAFIGFEMDTDDSIGLLFICNGNSLI